MLRCLSHLVHPPPAIQDAENHGCKQRYAEEFPADFNGMFDLYSQGEANPSIGSIRAAQSEAARGTAPIRKRALASTPQADARAARPVDGRRPQLP